MPAQATSSPRNASDTAPVDVTVIVPNFNGADYVGECLSAIPASGGPLTVETLLVDNASTDGSVDTVARGHPEVTIIRHATNQGFAAAVASGLALARGRYVLLLNSDARLHRNGLKRAVDHMDGHPTTGAVGFQLVNEDGSLQPSGRRFPTPLSLIASAWGLGPHEFREPGRDYTRTVVVDEVSGACMLIRRAALDRIGGIDPGYFFYMEDVDLCRRLWAEGFIVVYFPVSRVTHTWGRSSREVPELVRLEGRRSLLRYVARFHGRVWLGLLKLGLLPRDGLSLLHWLLRATIPGPAHRRAVARTATVLRTIALTVTHWPEPGAPSPLRMARAPSYDSKP